jgi:hypothetical protein
MGLKAKARIDEAKQGSREAGTDGTYASDSRREIVAVGSGSLGSPPFGTAPAETDLVPIRSHDFH